MVYQGIKAQTFVLLAIMMFGLMVRLRRNVYLYAVTSGACGTTLGAIASLFAASPTGYLITFITVTAIFSTAAGIAHEGDWMWSVSLALIVRTCLISNHFLIDGPRWGTKSD